MTSPELGTWQRVTSGPHRGRTGVVDLITDYAVGTRYRLSNRGGIVGRFPAEQLEAIPNPQTAYVSKVDAATTQKALGLLTKGAES